MFTRPKPIEPFHTLFIIKITYLIFKLLPIALADTYEK